MDLEEITLKLSSEVSRFSGKVEVFGEQVSQLGKTVKEVGERLNDLRIREAKREGEAKGIKRSALIISGVVSLIVSIIGATGVVIAYVR